MLGGEQSSWRLLRKEPEGGFTVTVPTLPGCVTFGKSLDDAMKMAKEAIELYLEALQAHCTLAGLRNGTEP